jgi:hypothetical protein
MPALEGLLPEPWDHHIQALLFKLCTWHGLAKLRMHTEDTLNALERLTILVGKAIRHFAKVVCPQFATIDTPSEAASRGRAAARKGSHVISRPNSGNMPATTRRPRMFNLQTYKLHAMGHYVEDIREFGTTDSYSTQVVCLLLLPRSDAFTQAHCMPRGNLPIAPSSHGIGTDLTRIHSHVNSPTLPSEPLKFTGQHRDCMPIKSQCLFTRLELMHAPQRSWNLSRWSKHIILLRIRAILCTWAYGSTSVMVILQLL